MRTPRTPRTLAFKLVGTGLVFLLLALGSITLTLWVTWQMEGGAAAVNEAGRVRMMSYRFALDAASGNRAALPTQAAAMNATFDLLEAGDPSRPLFVPPSRQSHAELASLRARWQVLSSGWQAGTLAVHSADVNAFVGDVDRFVSSIEQRLSRWTDVLRSFQLAMVAAVIASALLVLFAIHRLVLDPLRTLAQGLGAIRGGDFAVRVQLASGDEFGELAAGFNSMAERLASLYDGLEAKVRDKTAMLEVKRERLAALYEVSAFVAQADDLDTLARGFVSKVRRIAAADAIVVRWADEDNEHYVLLEHEGLPPELANDEQCLPSQHCHCGQSAATAQTRVIPIHSDRGLGNCAKAGFNTLLTVPISFQHRVLGEIDLLYRDVRELSEDDRSLIETLASHLAGGIESLRGRAAEREAAVAGERGLIAQELHDSIAQSLAFLKIQVELMRGALRRGDGDGANATLAEIDAGVRESYGDVRELLLHFRTRAHGQDIEAALRNTLQKFEHQTGLPTQLHVEGHGVPLPADVQVQVLHVLQEALTNVRKHAHATQVRVNLRRAPEWRFEVIDDGSGFDAAHDAGDSHVGLRIMSERAQRIGARYELHSSPGAGTRVVITVPRREADPSLAHEAHEHADSPAGR